MSPAACILPLLCAILPGVIHGARSGGTARTGGSGNFTCADKSRSISHDWVCDGLANCDDLSDERNDMCGELLPPGTIVKCSGDTVPCPSNGEPDSKHTVCVLRTSLCDGLIDCPDAGDESAAFCARHCERPGGVDYTLCADSFGCVPTVWRCDREPDCMDYSDEDIVLCERILTQPSWCPGNGWRCADYSKCLLRSFVCDGTDDCGDGSDERACEFHQCLDDEFDCSSVSYVGLDEADESQWATSGPRPRRKKQCIPKLHVCDGRYHCKNGADELISECRSSPAYSDGQCFPGQLRCTSVLIQTGGGRGPSAAALANAPLCVPAQWQCDGVTHCPGGEDERHCD